MLESDFALFKRHDHIEFMPERKDPDLTHVYKQISKSQIKLCVTTYVFVPNLDTTNIGIFIINVRFQKLLVV